jgi:hypothetical protein
MVGQVAGKGGNVFIDTSELTVSNQGVVFAGVGDGSGAGNAAGQGGRIEINADNINVNSSGSVQASTDFTSTGNGGDILIGTPSRPVQRLTLDRGSIVAATNGTGNGGNITVYAAQLQQLNGGTISAESGMMGGVAGTITLRINEQLRLLDSAIRSTAVNNDGGDITIRMSSPRATLDAQNSDIATEAGINGGNILLTGVHRLRVVDGDLTTRSAGAGGNISMQPEFVILNNGQINASAIEEDGGNITVQARHFLKSPDSIVNASSQRALPGDIAITTPNVDIVNSLVVLVSSIDNSATRLQESCTTRLAAPFSSFVVEGRGSSPIEPGNEFPSLFIHLPATETGD